MTNGYPAMTKHRFAMTKHYFAMTKLVVGR